MSRSTLNLRRLSRADWATLREVRLQALRDSPMAFMSRLEDEEGLTDADWQHSFDAAFWIVAEQAGEVIGLVKVAGEMPSTVRYLESIWVAPRHRRNRVFAALLANVIQTERCGGVGELHLWVLEDNHPARRSYEACGFSYTGTRQYLAHLSRFELEMRLQIKPT